MGFTLIELLIVILLIAGLAALLFAMTRSIRGKAHAAVCTQNLRTLGVTFQAYASENNGALPPSLDGVYWFGHLAPLIGIDNIKNDKIYVGQRCPGPFACPASKGLIHATGSQVADFGYNMNIPKFESASARIGYITKVEKPSKFILLAGTGEEGSTRTGRREISASSSWGLADRHNGKCNFLFLDGHSELHVPTELPTKGHDPWRP